LYTEQLHKSHDYSELKKAIGIHILNFTSIPETEDYHNTFRMRETKNNVNHFKDIELHTIELTKFEGTKGLKYVGKEEELKEMLPRIKTSLDRWATFIARYDLLERNKLPKELKYPQIEKALDVLEVMNFTKMEQEAYEEHLKWLRIEANTLKKAAAKGIEEGLLRGREEGIVDVAKKMLSKKMAVEMIAELTGLSEEEIKGL
jgi:predicted transposase/invertase (TIGR01784 family)